MEPETNQGKNLNMLTELEQRISGVLEDNGRLAKENRLLQQQQKKLSLEKAGLREKHRRVHAKIESMLDRLKTLEHSG